MAAAEKVLREQVNDQVVEWLGADGLTVEDLGTPDANAIRSRVVNVLAKRAVVGHKSERADKAITAGDLAHAVVPGMVGIAERYDSLGDIEQTAYHEVVKLVWRHTGPGENTHQQRLVGEALPGHVLCRVKIGIGDTRDETWVAYVTDDEELIFADFVKPSQVSAERAQRKMAATLALVGERKPELASKAETVLKRSLKASGDHARDLFQLRLAPAASETTTTD
jgi:hypothetical protein